jgi:uncharacterized protein (DUF1800 family)
MDDVLTRWAGRAWALALAVALAVLAGAAASPEVTFEVPATRAEVGRSRVVAFHAPKADEDRSFEVTCGSELEVLDKPTVLAGYTVGYARVRGVKAGSTTLSIGGGEIKVEVVARRVPEVKPEARIVQPASGAVVWGAFAAGVEVDQSDALSGESPKIELRLSTGQKIAPEGMTPLSMGPVRRVWFRVDTADLPVGPLSMWVAEPTAGAESEAKGQRVRVRVIKPDAVTKIEAEEPFTGKRPDRFQRDKLPIQNDSNCSGGKFVSNAASEPAVCVAFHVDSAGWYQAFVTAAADFGGGAYPTVGLIVDGGQNPVTNGRLCTNGWHRVAVGVPVKLAEGDRVLTPYFLNDFAARGSDRNLRLDYIELVRVEGGTEGGTGDGMMGEMAAQAKDAAKPSKDGAGADAPMAMMSMAPAMAADDGGDELLSPPLRIGLSRVLDGQVLAGDLTVEGYCWFEGIQNVSRVGPARVTLVINGREVSSQWALLPRFDVDAACWRRGENTVQLVARLASGATARTPVQTLRFKPPGDAPKGRPRESCRFTAADPRWDSGMRSRIQVEQNFGERAAAAFTSNGEAVLNVPEAFEGSYDLLLESRSQDVKSPAVATLRLKQGGGEPVLVKEFPAPNRWDTRKVATIDLKPGPKQLVLAFENSEDEGLGDRHLFVWSVTLRPVGSEADQTPPAVAIKYPSGGMTCCSADAVVAEAVDDRGLAWGELEIDDKATGIRIDTPNGTGRVVFPLLLRGVSPGKHSLTVRAVDDAKNESVSRAVSINVVSSLPALGRYERAVRLLDRFGFGPDPESLAGVLVQGEEAWLREALSKPLDDAGDLAAFENSAARFPNMRNNGDVQRQALMHALTTPNPARERFVIWVQNHFSTWIRKTEGQRKWEEHVAFERLGAAPFADLLECSSRSPAMLRYLDQENSYATRLNENYAREIMELHCLGVHAGYTQQDVTSLAHLLTGWTTSREGDGRSGGEIALYNFRFDPALNDRAETKVFGAAFPRADKEHAYGRIEDALDVLASHPETAKFNARKLADHYLGCPAPDNVVTELARVFMATDGDMKEVLMALSRHPAFWAPEEGAPKSAYPAERLAHPQDFVIRLMRVSRHTNAGQAADFLARVGQGMFDRATPDGFSERDSDYTDSNAMIQRWRLAQDISQDLTNLVPEPWRREPPAVKGVDGKMTVPPPDEAWAQRVVDVLAIRLTGRVLSDASNQAALKMLGEIEGKRQERVQKFAPLMAQLPEAHLR